MILPRYSTFEIVEAIIIIIITTENTTDIDGSFLVIRVMQAERRFLQFLAFIGQLRFSLVKPETFTFEATEARHLTTFLHSPARQQ